MPILFGVPTPCDMKNKRSEKYFDIFCNFSKRIFHGIKSVSSNLVFEVTENQSLACKDWHFVMKGSEEEWNWTLV